MRSIAVILSLTLTLSCTATALADEPAAWTIPVLRTTPRGAVHIIDGAEHKCFTASEWADLGHLLVDYRDLWRAAVRAESIEEAREDEVTALERRLDVAADRAALLTADRDWWRTVAETEHAARLELDRRNRSVEWIPWALVVVEALAIGVVGVASAAAD